MYDVFGFSFKLNLSTRPEKYLGDIKVWNEAEKVNNFINFLYESKVAAQVLQEHTAFWEVTVAACYLRNVT